MDCLGIMQAFEKGRIQKREKEIREQDKVKVDWSLHPIKPVWGRLTKKDALESPEIRQVLENAVEQGMNGLCQGVDDFHGSLLAGVRCRRCYSTDAVSCSHLMVADCMMYINNVYNATRSFLMTLNAKKKKEMLVILTGDNDKPCFDIRGIRVDVGVYKDAVRVHRTTLWWKMTSALACFQCENDEEVGFLGETITEASKFFGPVTDIDLNSKANIFVTRSIQSASPHRFQFESIGKIVSEIDELLFEGIFSVLESYKPMDSLPVDIYGEHFILVKDLGKAVQRTSKKLCGKICCCEDELFLAAAADQDEAN